jgi:hypothetical protein
MPRAAANSLVRAPALATDHQRSGIGDDEPEPSFDFFSSAVGGGGGSGVGSLVAGGSLSGTSGGGCSCVQAAKTSASKQQTEPASFDM